MTGSGPKGSAMTSNELREALATRARELGFDDCRVTHAEPPASGPQLLQALAEGRHAGMDWMARNAAKRADPQLVLPGARSVITLAVSYAAAEDKGNPPALPGPLGTGSPRGVVARYARHRDYHEVLGPRLQELTAWLDATADVGGRSVWYVDTGPVLERDLAQRAGLGFVGRHTGLISRELGNWFLLAEILTTVVLPPDPPARNLCGKCRRCLDACPTGALPAPFTLDSRRCISYLTIEHKGPIPEEFRPLIGDRIFGCDDCLAVCPWNRFAREARMLQPHRREDLGRPELEDLLKLDEAAFRLRFKGTPLLRTKRRGLLRNVCVALGNVGGLESIPALERAAAEPEPLISEHARWAIREIRRRTLPQTSTTG